MEMAQRTVTWSGWGAGADDGVDGAGLRERKKHRMRQHLSDTATEMFMERGFDAVRVAEVAEACGVSEKTVFNYFPTKESLVLDRWDTTMASLRSDLADPDRSPLEAALGILATEMDGLLAWLADQDDPVAACASFRRFGALVHSTAALRAHQHEMADRLTEAVAEKLATRWGMAPQSPETQMAAAGIVGLWRTQAMSLGSHLDGRRTIRSIRQAVLSDVARAARVLELGLRSLEPAGG
jgi:AcrR family transcriptional regulator